MTAKEFNRCLDALPNDRNALEKIYNEYYLQLVYTALSMTKNREAAYDIASTVMLKLAGYRRTEWINSPAGFLIRMVHNVTKDYFRKENRCMEALPEEIAAASDLNSQLFYEDAMDSFTAEEKLIVTERLWGYKLKEIARRKHYSYAIIKRRYSVIKQKLKDYVETNKEMNYEQN